ncbi:hypothetical protein CH289_18170 [Rhodococcus sp. RS1C4]|uniref:hypothetical protein n=1 Tax=Nocardiaceae TaxID=85025 RepID=UPI000365E4E9|nr:MULTISPECIES: hypothetical protein [Rhodococcus]OZC49101.1 hypothetical protein CH289_18170 [Rhodococcus sp. RS1C4]
MSIVVDHEEIRLQAGYVRDAATRVDEVAPSIPGAVDGGVGTAAILGILSNFVASAGELVSGLAGLNVTLNECATRYAEQDIVAADEINVAAWAE